jgi:hypothetical protein
MFYMPYERLFRSLRSPWIIEELRAEHVVDVLCLDCRRQALVAPHVIIERYKLSTRLGDNVPLFALPKRSRAAAGAQGTTTERRSLC